jgi:hypothetical protein
LDWGHHETQKGLLKQKDSMLFIPVAAGDLVDRITILEIKQQQFHGQALKHVTQELELLVSICQQADPSFRPGLRDELKAVNAELWNVEEAIRRCEKDGNFGQGFVQLARSVYTLNDRRAELKRAINLESGSQLVEEKSYG